MNERNYGIDLLRIISMFYVIVLHVLGAGGILAGSMDRAHSLSAWFLEAFAYCAVDCFALISGYVGYKKNSDKLKMSHYMNLWFQVVFYNLLVTVAFNFIMPEKVEVIHYIKCFLPVTFNLHWYFTAYTGLFFLMPLINTAVDKMDDIALKKLAIIIILCFSLYGTFTGVDRNIFTLNKGYSVFWLMVLYFIGAVIKKTDLFSRVSTQNGIAYILASVIFSELWGQYRGVINTTFVSSVITRISFISYISPTILAVAILHIVIFSRFKLTDKMTELIKFSAKGAFAVYLLNTQYFIWNYLMCNRFSFLCTAPIYWLPIITIGFSILFVVAAMLIDYLRRILFELMKISLATNYIESILTSCFERLFQL